MAINIPTQVNQDLSGTNYSLEYFVVLNADFDPDKDYPIYIGCSNFNILDENNQNIRVNDYGLRVSKIQESINYETKKVKISNCSLTISNKKVNNSRLSEVIEDSCPSIASLFDEVDTHSIFKKTFKVYAKTQGCKTIEDCMQVGYFKVFRYTYDESTATIEGMDDWLNTFFVDLPKVTTNIDENTSSILEDEENTFSLYDGKHVPILYGHLKQAPSVIYLDNVSNTTDYLADNLIKVLADDSYIRGYSRKSYGIAPYLGCHPYAESFAQYYNFNEPRCFRNKDTMDSLQVDLGGTTANIPILPHLRNNDQIKELWTYPQYLIGTRHPSSNYPQPNYNAGHHFDHISLNTWWWSDTKVQKGVMWCNEIATPNSFFGHFMAGAFVPDLSYSSAEKHYQGTLESTMYKASEDNTISPYFRYDNNYLGFSIENFDTNTTTIDTWTKSFLKTAFYVYNDAYYDSNAEGYEPWLSPTIYNNNDEWSPITGTHNNGTVARKYEMGIETLQFPPLSADLDIYTEYTYDTGETEYPQDSRLFGRHRFSQTPIYIDGSISSSNDLYTGIAYIPYKPVVDYNIIDQYMTDFTTTLFPDNFYDFSQLSGLYATYDDDLFPNFPITFKYAGFSRAEQSFNPSWKIISNLTSQFHPFYSTIQGDENRENTMTFTNNTFEDELSEVYNPGASTDSMTGYYYMNQNDTNLLSGAGAYLGTSQWYGAGLDRTWAQKNIFSNRFYTNAYGKLSQNPDQSAGDITSPVRYKGIIYLPHTYEYLGLDDEGNPIIPGQGSEGEQNTYSEKDNWSFWTLYSLLINDKQSITYGKERLELMLYARDSVGGGGLNQATGDLGGYQFGEDLLVFPNQPSGVFEYGGERELIFYNIKFGDIILPNPPDESQEDDLYIQPPFESGNALDTQVGAVNPLEPFYTEKTFGTYIGIKFESDMISKPYENYGDAPPVDLHHMAEGITNYYYSCWRFGFMGFKVRIWQVTS